MAARVRIIFYEKSTYLRAQGRKLFLRQRTERGYVVNIFKY